MGSTGSLLIGRFVAILFLIVGIALFVQRIYYIVKYDRVKATIVDVVTRNEDVLLSYRYEYQHPDLAGLFGSTER